MKAILNIYFIVCLSLYVLIRFAELILNTHLAWVSNYLTDLLCMPIVLCILWFILISVQKIKKHLPFYFIAIVFLNWSFYFEYYLPSVNSDYTGDFWDVLCYLIGAISFFVFQRREIQKQLILKFD